MFSDRLKAARERAGFDSAESFADMMGIGAHTYRHYEAGRTNPTLETLSRICVALHITPNDLLIKAPTHSRHLYTGRTTPDGDGQPPLPDRLK
jgi:transcriptional regulator with XRE-family HTH domain